MSVEERLHEIEEKITCAAQKSGRTRQDISLIGVTKTVPIEKISAVYSLGLCDFGENRTVELAHKQQILPRATWHMIGRLQTNKVKDIILPAALIHSLDRWDLAEEINKRAAAVNKVMNCLLQVNVAGEKQKGGVAPQAVEAFLQSMDKLPNLRVQGLMMIAPLEENREKSRIFFKKMKILFDNMGERRYNGVVMEYLSMGMSGDYETAIEEGANMVRIGTAIFAD